MSWIAIKAKNFFDIEDIRYHDYYRSLPEGRVNISLDFSNRPGLPGVWPMEYPLINKSSEITILTNRYWHWSIYLSIGYIIVIFGLKAIMDRREKGFDLKRELIIWNWFLAIFSILGTIRCLPEFIHEFRRLGFTGSYTQNTYIEDPRISLWYLFFTLSKAPELVDTLFIVLRKRRLIQLHWIHHTLTLIYSWFVFPDCPSTARWMVNMNLFVHSLMYSYYALTAMGYRPPKQFNMTLTTLQIIQMLFGFYINIDCLRRKLSNQPADLSLSVALAGFSLYFLFFMLFVNFFIRTYIIPSSRNAVKAAMANSKNILADLNNNANGKIGKEVVKKLQ